MQIRLHNEYYVTIWKCVRCLARSTAAVDDSGNISTTSPVVAEKKNQ